MLVCSSPFTLTIEATANVNIHYLAPLSGEIKHILQNESKYHDILTVTGQFITFPITAKADAEDNMSRDSQIPGSTCTVDSPQIGFLYYAVEIKQGAKSMDSTKENGL